jgi:mannose-1-phosphate guanylyltransferase
MNRNVHIVVIAGGSGTRFWPLSRQRRPKQLLALGGGETLLAGTFTRVEAVAPPSRWWMVVGKGHAQGCREAAPRVPAAQVVVEPVARNTAPAIGLAAVHLAAVDPDAILVVLPADHHVAQPAALCAAIDTAVTAAQKGAIVTLGITPSRPETGYGYIQRGAPDARAAGAFQVQRFCEKPDVERAKGFLAQGGHDWNAGIFVARAQTVLAEIERQLPAVHGALSSVRGALGKPGYESTLEAAFASIKGVSFDYGVMEGARDVCVVPTSCGWSDVGSFDALDAVIARNAAGNVVAGRVVEIDTKDCILHAAPGQVLAAVGVSGLAVIQTADATLIVPVSRAQQVREVLERLGEKGWSEYL